MQIKYFVIKSNVWRWGEGISGHCSSAPMCHLAILMCTEAVIQIFRTSVPEVSYLTPCVGVPKSPFFSKHSQGQRISQCSALSSGIRRTLHSSFTLASQIVSSWLMWLSCWFSHTYLMLHIYASIWSSLQENKLCFLILSHGAFFLAEIWHVHFHNWLLPALCIYFSCPMWCFFSLVNLWWWKNKVDWIMKLNEQSANTVLGYLLIVL